MAKAETNPVGVACLVRELVVDEVDEAVHGVTFDGRRLVLASGYRLFRVVPDTGRLVDELETFPDRGGLAFDGRHLWQSSQGVLQEIDPRTGFARRSIGWGLSDVTGLERIGDDALVLHAGGRKLTRLELLDATAVNACDSKVALRGLAWVGRDLWSSAPGQLCQIDPASAQVVARFALPPEIDVCDLAADADGGIWCVDGRSRVLRLLVPSEPR